MTAARTERVDPIEDGPEIRREIASAPTALPGMYYFNGRMHVRRFAPVRPFNLTCRLNHPMEVRDRPLTSTPQCSHHDKPGRGETRCKAHLFMYRLSAFRYLVLDITPEEADIIHSQRMDIDEVIVYFSLELPRVA